MPRSARKDTLLAEITSYARILSYQTEPIFPCMRGMSATALSKWKEIVTQGRSDVLCPTCAGRIYHYSGRVLHVLDTEIDKLHESCGI